MTSGKPIIFISYAHADEPESPVEGEIKWLTFVLGFLKPPVKHGLIEFWVDRHMGTRKSTRNCGSATFSFCSFRVTRWRPTTSSTRRRDYPRAAGSRRGNGRGKRPRVQFAAIAARRARPSLWASLPARQPNGTHEAGDRTFRQLTRLPGHALGAGKIDNCGIFRA
jgi:hypothetical protein